MAAFYQQMPYAFIREDSILAHFSGMLFEQVIARYNALTSQFQQLTRQELVTRLSARVPVDTREGGGNRTLFKFWLKIFAGFVEKTKKFNYFCSRYRSVD